MTGQKAELASYGRAPNGVVNGAQRDGTGRLAQGPIVPIFVLPPPTLQSNLADLRQQVSTSVFSRETPDHLGESYTRQRLHSSGSTTVTIAVTRTYYVDGTCRRPDQR